jgi:hypothetical protein
MTRREPHTGRRDSRLLGRSRERRLRRELLRQMIASSGRIDWAQQAVDSFAEFDRSLFGCVRIPNGCGLANHLAGRDA